MLAVEMRGACQPMTMPAVTAASTPEQPSRSAGRYAAYPLSREIVISTGMSFSRRRTSAMSQPTASPTRMPPAPPSTNSMPASHSENDPHTAAAAATL